MIRTSQAVLSSVILSVSLVAASQLARADEGKETASHPPARILGAGQDEAGNHAVLYRNSQGKAEVHVGQPGHLKEIEVLSIERGKDSYAVDTLEHGLVIFHTRESRVIFPGDVGFNAKNPTRVFGKAPTTHVTEHFEGRGEAGKAQGRAMRSPSGSTVNLRGGVTDAPAGHEGVVRAMQRSRTSGRASLRRRTGVSRARAAARVRGRTRARAVRRAR